MYADVEYYKNVYSGTIIPNEQIKKALDKAAKHIDALTYNRIVGRGINTLTNYQQEIIKNTNCLIAEFETENAELIENVLQSYAINGVSISFGNSWNVLVQNGIAIKRDIYEGLSQTGLCSRGLGGR